MKRILSSPGRLAALTLGIGLAALPRPAALADAVPQTVPVNFSGGGGSPVTVSFPQALTFEFTQTYPGPVTLGIAIDVMKAPAYEAAEGAIRSMLVEESQVGLDIFLPADTNSSLIMNVPPGFDTSGFVTGLCFIAGGIDAGDRVTLAPGSQFSSTGNFAGPVPPDGLYEVYFHDDLTIVSAAATTGSSPPPPALEPAEVIEGLNGIVNVAEFAFGPGIYRDDEFIYDAAVGYAPDVLGEGASFSAIAISHGPGGGRIEPALMPGWDSSTISRAMWDAEPGAGSANLLVDDLFFPTDEIGSFESLFGPDDTAVTIFSRVFISQGGAAVTETNDVDSYDGLSELADFAFQRITGGAQSEFVAFNSDGSILDRSYMAPPAPEGLTLTFREVPGAPGGTDVVMTATGAVDANPSWSEDAVDSYPPFAQVSGTGVVLLPGGGVEQEMAWGSSVEAHFALLGASSRSGVGDSGTTRHFELFVDGVFRWADESTVADGAPPSTPFVGDFSITFPGQSISTFGFSPDLVFDTPYLLWTAGGAPTAANEIRFIVEAPSAGDDTEPPVIDAPGVVRATAGEGQTSAAVSFTVTATDDTDPAPSLTCDPPSGSTFPWGTTAVTCTATDASGNVSTSRFLVSVSLPGDVLLLGPTTGGAAPGADGSEETGAGGFTGFRGAHLAGAGQLLIDAEAGAASVRGLWAGPVGALREAALVGSTAAADGAVLHGIDIYALSPGGAVSVRGRDASGDSGDWLAPDGSAAAGIGFVGEAAPDIAGATFAKFPLGGSALNEHGEHFALGYVEKDAALGITDLNNSGVWSSDDGLVLREGDPSPVAGATYGKFGNGFAANGDGHLAFDTTLVGAGGANRALFCGPASTPALVARRADAAPGIAGATFERFQPASLNPSGEVAFPAQVIGGGVTTDDNDGIWTDAGGTLQLVAREGGAAPGGDGSVFVSFFDISITDAADESGEKLVVFGANLRNDALPLSATEDSGYYAFAASAGSLVPLAQEGAVAPGTSGVFRSLSALSVHRSGGFAFAGALLRGVGGVTRSNDNGVWCGSVALGTGGTGLLIRAGEVFTDAGGVERPIGRAFISEPSGGGTAGRSSAVSYGNVAVIATYDNNRSTSILILGKPAPQAAE